MSGLIKERMGILEILKLNKEKIATATQRLGQSQFDECLVELNGVDFKSLNDDQKTTIDLLKSQAAFGGHWETYRRRPGEPAAEQKELLTLIDSSPTAIGPDKLKLDGYEQRAEDLNCDIAMKELESSEYDSVERYTVDAKRVLGMCSRYHREVVSTYRKWLQNRFQRKVEPRYPADLQEAEGKNNKNLRGMFSTTDGKVFSFWEYNGTAYAKRPVTKYLGSDILSKPHKPPDVQWIREYNRVLTKLSADIGSREQWEIFAETCNRASSELGGQASKNLSFETEARQARDVLAIWPDVDAILTQ